MLRTYPFWQSFVIIYHLLLRKTFRVYRGLLYKTKETPRKMESPMPPFSPLPTPPPNAKEWRGVAELENGLSCTYYMADSEACAAKRAKFVEDGPDNMIIISDFDRTISNALYTGMVYL